MNGLGKAGHQVVYEAEAGIEGDNAGRRQMAAREQW